MISPRSFCRPETSAARIDRAFPRERNIHRFPTPDACVSHSRIRLEEPRYGDTLGAPIEKPLGILLALLLVRKPHDDADETAPLLAHLRGHDHAVTRFLRVAGLHPIHTRFTEQGVAVEKAMLAIVELFLTEDGKMFRVFADDVAREECQFARRHALVGIAEPRGIGERRCLKPNSARFIGHHHGELVDRAREPSATVRQASFPDCTTIPRMSSEIGVDVLMGMNIADVPEGAPPVRQAYSLVLNSVSSLTVPS